MTLGIVGSRDYKETTKKTKQLPKYKFKVGDIVIIDTEFMEKNFNKIKWEVWEDNNKVRREILLNSVLVVLKILDYSDGKSDINRINYIVDCNGKDAQLHEFWLKVSDFLENDDFSIE